MKKEKKTKTKDLLKGRRYKECRDCLNLVAKFYNCEDCEIRKEKESNWKHTK